MSWTFTLNFLGIVIAALLVTLFVYFHFKEDTEAAPAEEEDYSVENYANKIKEMFNKIINQNVAELGLNQVETQKREQLKANISKAWRNCPYGDPGEKEFVKDYMKNLLQKHMESLNINEKIIERVIPFSSPDRLSGQDKGEILLYYYKVKKACGGNAYSTMVKENNINIEKKYEDGIYHEISVVDIDEIYGTVHPILTYVDKLEIVTQRIYQQAKGLGVVDELRDQSCLDGVSGGIAGIVDEDYNYMEEVILDKEEKHYFRHDSIAILLEGNTIRLSYLSFGSKRELERVCKNIYRYDAPFYLSGIRGKIVAEDKKGNRIAVARPPFADSWKFFVRKAESSNNLTIEELLNDEGNEIPITVMKYIVIGLMVIVITGNMGTGKTTLLRALIRYIDATLNTRVEEDISETQFNKMYRRKNISAFRKTETISVEEGVEFIRRTDGDVIIQSEIIEQIEAAVFFLVSKFTYLTMCTCHPLTTPKMIEFFRNALVSTKQFSSEEEAEKQVVETIRWNFQTEKIRKGPRKGHRYLERITEIIPRKEEDVPEDISLKDAIHLYFKKKISKKYDYLDIVIYEDGKYIVKNPISKESLEKIRQNLSEEESEEFETFYKKYFGHLYNKEEEYA